jgi:hypothetical protein
VAREVKMVSQNESLLAPAKPIIHTIEEVSLMDRLIETQFPKKHCQKEREDLYEKF